MKKNRFLYSLIIFGVLGLCGFASLFASASEIEYHYFESAELLATDESCLYVVDGDTLTALSKDDLSQSKTMLLASGGASFIFAHSGTIYSIEGGELFLYQFDADAPTDPVLSGSFSSVFVDDSNIYLAEGDSILVYEKSTLDLKVTLFGGGKDIECFAVLDGIAYAATSSGNGRRSSIYSQSIGGGAVVQSLYDSPSIYSLVSIEQTKTLAALTGSSIVYYKKGISELFSTVSVEADEYISICAYDNIFALDTVGSIVSFSQDLSAWQTILANRIQAEGFYFNPCDLTTRFGKIYVADKGNNRISIQHNDTFSFINGLTRPASVAVDSDANVFVAHSENKIAVYDSQNKLVSDEIAKVKSGQTQEELASVIEDILFDGRENLFLLTKNNNLFVRKSGLQAYEQVNLVGIDKIYAIDAPSDSIELFALVQSGVDTKVAKISSASEGNLQATLLGIDAENAIDIACDTDKSIYLLKNSNLLLRYELVEDAFTQAFSSNIAPQNILSKIAVSNIMSDTVSYRDLIMLDSVKSRIKVVASSELMLTIPNQSQQESLPSDYKTLLSSATPLLRTVTRAGGANVYAQSSEVSPIAFLPHGFRVIVPSFDQDKKYTKIICDNLDGQATAPIVGYINTNYLSDAMPYAPQPSATCRVWLHNISIYSLPAKQSPSIVGFDSVEKNTVLELLDFVQTDSVYGYSDNFSGTSNNIWYRVKVTSGGKDYEGFVFASNVSTSSFIPDQTRRPQTNAVIKSLDENQPNLAADAYFYDADTDSYIVDSTYGKIAVGTKVEILGIFDPTSEYTKILFYLPDYGAIEAYVKTANIEYKGVNFLQIISISIICITFALIGFLAMRRTKTQREKMR